MPKASAYPYMGAKYYEASRLIPLFPKHRYYYEVFFGSGVLLINKPPVENEFANDIYTEIISFWICMQDKDKYEELKQKCSMIFDSLYLYKSLMNKKPEELSDVDRAFRFLYLIKFGFNSYPNCYYSPITHKYDKIKDFMNVWENAISRFPEYHTRMKRVHFSNLDFRDFLSKIEPHPDKFIFLDPPYLKTHSYADYTGEENFSKEGYIDMRNLLEKQTAGGTKWMITCNQINDSFDEMKDIIIKLIDRKACMNNNEERADVKTKVIMNYDINETGRIIDEYYDPEIEGEFLDV